MKRRIFTQQMGLSLFSALLIPQTGIGSNKFVEISVKRLSSPPLPHFFGYYGINPWDPTMTYHLALETKIDDHRPTIHDSAKVGYIDINTHLFTPITETPAFNLQQGTMMHWIGEQEFTYNDYQDGKLISYVINFQTQQKRLIHGAIAAVSPDHNHAIGLNFQRMSYCRPTVGYAHQENGYELDFIPSDDGLYSLDLNRGESSLLLPISEVIDQYKGDLPVSNQPVWFNHVLYNPTGERILFYCRIRKRDRGGFFTSLWTVNSDGSDLKCQTTFEHHVSHFDWKDEKTMLITSDMLGDFMYLEFTDGKKNYTPIGKGILTVDGHCSYLDDPNWILSDTYPLGEERLAELFLFNIQENRKISLGKFHHPDIYRKVVRCDLHPRMSHRGNIISFDSVHEGVRQIYMVDVSEMIKM